MPKERRKFTNEFKSQMVQLYGSGKSRTDLVREYGLSASALVDGLNKVKPQVLSRRKLIAHLKKMSSSPYAKKINGSRWKTIF